MYVCQNIYVRAEPYSLDCHGGAMNMYNCVMKSLATGNTQAKLENWHFFVKVVIFASVLPKVQKFVDFPQNEILMFF